MRRTVWDEMSMARRVRLIVVTAVIAFAVALTMTTGVAIPEMHPVLVIVGTMLGPALGIFVLSRTEAEGPDRG